MPAGRIAATFALLATLAGGAPACTRDSTTDVLDGVRGAVTLWLDGAAVRSVSAPERTKSGWRKTLPWRAETNLPWGDVVARLTQHSPAGFRGCEAHDQRIVCLRQTEGDTIQAAVEADGPQTRSNLRVIVSADAS